MLKLLIAGDVCMRGQEDTMTKDCARKILSSVKPYLDNADIRIVNWENPTTKANEGAPIPKSGAMLHSKPENIVFLEEAGFNVALMANNHTGDYGPTGTMATKMYLETAGILTVGAGINIEEARKPLFISQNDQTVAIFSTCEYEFGIADRTTPGAAGFDAYDLRRRITDARKVADHILVIHHGGNEYNPLPSPQNRTRYQEVIDMGADALIGMHPHCPQGYELYHQKPIIYSTGNFMFQTMDPNMAANNSWNYGYLVSLLFEKGKNATFDIIPYQIDVRTNIIKIMTGTAKTTMLTYLDDISQRFRDPIEHEHLYMGWCMIAAPNYANMTKFDISMVEEPDNPHTLALRNVFTCQAHNELITTYLRMIVERKLTIGKKYEPIVRELQKMPVNIC